MSTTATKERPVLFSGSMIRALLNGQKTQTRRIVTNPRGSRVDVQRAEWVEQYANAMGLRQCWSFMREMSRDHPAYGKRLACNSIAIDTLPCPHGRPGERLWVRETHSLHRGSSTPASLADATYCCFPDGSQTFKSGDYYPWDKPVSGNWPKGHRWRPSIQMPRWASRIILEITSVRVGRVQEISEEDAEAEGVEYNRGPFRDGHTNARSAFKSLWDQLHGAGSWAANPWVWCIAFKRLEPTP